MCVIYVSLSAFVHIIHDLPTILSPFTKWYIHKTLMENGAMIIINFIELLCESSISLRNSSVEFQQCLDFNYTLSVMLNVRSCVCVCWVRSVASTIDEVSTAKSTTFEPNPNQSNLIILFLGVMSILELPIHESNGCREHLSVHFPARLSHDWRFSYWNYIQSFAWVNLFQ